VSALTRPLVKLCGLRTPDDVDAAVAAGADAVGLVLCASPRRVERAEAATLLARVPAGVLRVAVMAAPSAGCIGLANALPFDAVQCELDDAPLPRLAAGRFLLPALRDGDDVEARAARARRRLAQDAPAASHAFADAVLLDGPRGGGRGSQPAPERAQAMARNTRLVLAGGLTPDNVAARVAAIGPFAVDVSSGIERERGVKDAGRMRAFVEAARSAVPAPPSPVPDEVQP